MLISKQLSIKKITLIIFTVMYLLFFIITSLNLYSYSSYESQKTENLIVNFNTGLSNQITEKLANISDVSKYPLLIPEISKLHDILTKNTNYKIEDYNYLKYLCQMMLIQNSSINGAFIYNLDGNGIYTSRNLYNDQLKNISSEKWFDESINSDNIVNFIPNVNTNELFQFNSSNKEKLIGVTRKIIDSNTQRLTGLILITLPIYEFSNILLNDIPFNNEVLTVYNNTGNTIFSTDYSDKPYIIDLPLNSTNYDPIIQYPSNNPKDLVCYNTITSTDWILVNSIPRSQAFNISSLYIVSFISNIFLCLVLFSILYMLFIKRIFNPINSLINNMDKNVENSLKHEIEYNKDDEIGVLFKSYNEMKSRINSLITINYKNKIEQKELELNQLQIQINPHFIYNTLESIHMMAEINDDLETSLMAENFGVIIRYSMNRKINTVTLTEEIAIIESYIYLQKIRFDQLFTIENLIEPDVLNCEIIKMIIQPLIENSIYHGLSECSSNGKIIIQAIKIDNNLALTISDNGIGIEEEKLKELNSYINDGNNNFKGIALRNINRRLKLNYGEEYGLKIFSVFGKGTSMLLTLPYKIKN